MGAKDLSRELLELAIVTRERGAFAGAALEILMRALGFAGAFFLGQGGRRPELVVTGFGPGYRERLLQGMARYEPELAAVKRQALASGGVAVDTAVLGRAAEQTCYYDELAREHGGGHSLSCFAHLRGTPQGLLVMARGQAARGWTGRCRKGGAG